MESGDDDLKKTTRKKNDGDDDGLASSGAKIALLMLETRVPADALEDMLAVGVEGCERLRRILDAVVRAS